jgi:L-asparagine transporter-like permease
MATAKLKTVVLLHAAVNVGLLILFVFSAICILLLSVRPGWTYWYTYPTWIIAFIIYYKYMKKFEDYLVKNKKKFFPQDIK